MKARRTIWTEEDQAKLATMLDAGASTQRISIALKRPLDSIKQRARALGKPSLMNETWRANARRS